MDNRQAQLLQDTNNRVRKLERAMVDVREATKPRIHGLVAAALAVVIVIPAAYIGYSQLPQDVQDGGAKATDWAANKLVTAGRAWADYTGNVDRSYSAPTNDLTLIGLDAVQSCRWRYVLRQREASGRYDHPGNRYGYFAGYGFGAWSLQFAGLVKRSAYQSAPYKVRNGTDQRAWLNDASNWTLQGGKETFLASPHLQDIAVTALANANIEDGFDNRALIRTKPDQIAGFAAAAHLKGLTAALNWHLRGKDSADANGTKTSDYAKMGAAAIDQNVAECGDGGTITQPGIINRMIEGIRNAI